MIALGAILLIAGFCCAFGVIGAGAVSGDNGMAGVLALLAGVLCAAGYFFLTHF